MEKRRGLVVVVRCSLEATQDAAEAVAVEGQVTEVTKDTFWPIVKAAGDKVVVLDMYTQWYASYLHSFFFCNSNTLMYIFNLFFISFNFQMDSIN
jgi:hypothetical protein